MKGVLLAGGSGSRLSPLTRITNKHLLPLYDRPMVTYAVEALVDAVCTEMILITGGTHAGEFFRLLGNGHAYGIDRLFYAYQERPGGIAEALGLAERFVDGDRCCVLLADNVFELPLGPVADRFAAPERGARIVLSQVTDVGHLRHLGVAELNGGGVVRIVEKPLNNWYVDRGEMEVDVLEGFWGDAGESIDAYYVVNDFIRRKRGGG
jgi:glucose-1-phosphate thymidylyltransferase